MWTLFIVALRSYVTVERSSVDIVYVRSVFVCYGKAWPSCFTHHSDILASCSLVDADICYRSLVSHGEALEKKKERKKRAGFFWSVLVDIFGEIMSSCSRNALIGN